MVPIFPATWDIAGVEASKRNIMTYNASIAACHAGGQWKRALSLFAELEAMTLESSSITFNALLSVCARQRQWAQAFDLLQSFPQKSWDVVTYAEAANDAALWDVLLGRSGAGNAPDARLRDGRRQNEREERRG
ncbi:Pentatricopeptide repeat-containing protein At2g31400 [Durusdinium trenchii]|uniref:Chloroplastic n=1 Tax=Durusdinium trenchii TaxID=1381693 RepID=A0ABP0HUG0_9DINO